MCVWGKHSGYGGAKKCWIRNSEHLYCLHTTQDGDAWAGRSRYTALTTAVLTELTVPLRGNWRRELEAGTVSATTPSAVKCRMILLVEDCWAPVFGEVKSWDEQSPETFRMRSNPSNLYFSSPHLRGCSPWRFLILWTGWGAPQISLWVHAPGVSLLGSQTVFVTFIPFGV